MSRHQPLSPSERAVGALLAAYFLAGFLHQGYGGEGPWHAAGLAIAALLGLAAAWRWSMEEASRHPPWITGLLAGLGVLCAWSLVQLLPLPTAFVTALSPAHLELAADMQRAGMAVPAGMTLSQDPESGWRTWNIMVAGWMMLAAAAPLAARQKGRRLLALLVGGSAVASGIGACVAHFVLRADRPAWPLFNSNHHAYFVLMGLPLWFAWILHRVKTAGRTAGEALLGVEVLFAILGFAALLGALAGLSRGALLVAMPLFLLWGVVEWWLASSTHRGRRAAVMGPVVLGAGLVVAAGFSKGYLARLGKGDLGSGNSRTEFWHAEWQALEESRFLGIGIGGSRVAINRHIDTPLFKLPVHAHNDWLEWIAELGAPGVLLVVLVPGAVLWRGRRRLTFTHPGRWGTERRAACCGTAIFLSASLIDFPGRVPLALAAALLTMALSLTPDPRKLRAQGQNEEPT